MISSVSDSVLVMAGSALTLTCSSEGNPAPVISWSFRTTEGGSEPVGEGPQLDLRALSVSQSGWYLCTASNSEGNNTAAVKVTVYGETYAEFSVSFRKDLIIATIATLAANLSALVLFIKNAKMRINHCTTRRGF